MKKALIALTFLAVASGGLFFVLNSRAATIPWRKDLQAARRDAEKAGKPLLLYLQTEWCTYCKQMEETTLRDPLLTRDMAPGYVWVKLDAEKSDEGRKLRDALGVSAYPAIVLFDAQGQELDRMQGYFAAAKFKEAIEFFQSSPTSYGNIREQAAKFPDSMTLQYALGEKLLERGNFLEAAKQFAMVIGHDPENRSALADTAYYNFAYALASGGQPEEALRQIEILTEKFPKSQFVADGAVLKGQILYYGGKAEKAEAVLEDYLEKFPEHGNRQWVSELVRQIRAERIPLASSH